MSQMAKATMLALLSLNTPSPVLADKEPINLPAYPEISFDRALPGIVDALSSLLSDPASISSFLACPVPVKIKLEQDRPKQWTFMFSLNAKNRMGGYAGATGYAAVVKSNNSVRVFSILAPLPDKNGCKRIPDAEIQRLLAG